MAETRYTDSYIKRARRFIKKYPAIIPQYEKTLRLIELNLLHPSLRLQRLHGRLSELYSLSINISCRISLLFIVEDDVVMPVDIGSHDEVY